MFSDTSPTPSRRSEVIPVSELNRRARHLLEANLELLWVSGELSNVMRAASGHWYFSLKDAQAQVRCVMFRNRAAAIGFTPENGMQVEIRALPSLYEPRGEFQLGVENMRRAGLGVLYEAFERLKARLLAEGLFQDDRKRSLHPFPKVLGVVTSLKAAALRDVLTTLKRRAPMINIIVYPASVQGSAAAQELAGAIDLARTRIAADRIEALVVCRGGGSIEDLWSFNEEIVARAIVRFQEETEIAVVSGVGHETDFTICDFVADRRAPTPTAAAELVSPDVTELRVQVSVMTSTLARVLRRVLDHAAQRLDRASRSLVSPEERLQRERTRLAMISTQIRNALVNRLAGSQHRVETLRRRLASESVDIAQLRQNLEQRRRYLIQSRTRLLANKKMRLDNARQSLSLLDPSRVLERGYSIVEYQGVPLRDAGDVATGANLQIRLARGRLEAAVTATLPAQADET